MAFRPTYAEVDLAAIQHNVRILRERVGVPLTAVVKADAYGHGAVPVARAVVAAGAERLAVATVDEGIELRTAGLALPILVLGWTPPDAVEPALRFGLTLTVFDRPSLEAIAAVAARTGLTATVHVKLDTGMGRLGFPTWRGDGLAELAALLTRPGIDVEALYTHLSAADDDDAYTSAQLARFDAACQRLREAGLNFRLRHAANSAGALRFPASRYDTVRLGIALYGLDAFPGAARAAGLRPALRWRTAVAQVKVIEAGIGISYGHTYVPDRPVRVAVLAVGYADGYDRALSNLGQVLIGGRRARVLGRVCMDQVIVGEVDEGVRPGDEAVLLGAQGDDEITASEMADWLETIPYEVVTRIGARVPRRYVGA